ncbi:MAG: hypothetical protein K1X67_25980 [Fimbriimonadaceae bacterium]|nr:hypothetical protein [Fimbriimonadaceae bacterium]
MNESGTDRITHFPAAGAFSRNAERGDMKDGFFDRRLLKLFEKVRAALGPCTACLPDGGEEKLPANEWFNRVCEWIELYQNGCTRDTYPKFDKESGWLSYDTDDISMGVKGDVLEITIGEADDPALYFRWDRGANLVNKGEDSLPRYHILDHWSQRGQSVVVNHKRLAETHITKREEADKAIVEMLSGALRAEVLHTLWFPTAK